MHEKQAGRADVLSGRGINHYTQPNHAAGHKQKCRNKCFLHFYRLWSSSR